MASIPTLETEIFPLNLGGNTFGWTSDRVGSEAVLDAFVTAGGNFIDTADSYSAWVPGNRGGESEEIIGDWMAARGNRDDLVIATKVGALQGRKGLAPDNVRAAVDDSLRRLRTDRIDLYYAHYDDTERPIEEIAATFDALVRDGRIRAIGMSNITPERMRAWLDAAAAEGLTAPVALQPEYNLVARHRYETGYAPIAASAGLAVFPYYALASGFLSGKYRTPEDLQRSVRGRRAEGHLNADGLGVVDALVAVAEEHGVAPATVALAWLLAKGVTAPIASARTTQQLPDLVAAAALTLTQEQVAALDKASAPFA
ncbi:aldo/keto reductase [Raineyella fluvialis]|uniref:Aldo/keto reductase n=1 Tax=Raineyella fluvialis TaxID=2662261 RepID=A0A5Q2F904_9ACTN|nr:aldo/keto reductase [Raineyella fluvialis]QGF23158.1 aldo/keto reductase [Raineyella fluvialis]